MNYFVYVYLDPRKLGLYVYGNFTFNYEPFYVGKGKNKRDLDHINEAKYEKRNYNPHKNRKIRKILNENLTPIILRLSENLSDEDAQKLEIQLISSIGRFDLKRGPLTNLTDGGDGSSNIKQSEETKNKRKKSLKAYRDSPNAYFKSGEFKKTKSKHWTDFYTIEKNRITSSINKIGEKNPQFGKTTSDKQKAAASKAAKKKKGSKLSLLTKQNISKGKTGIKNSKIRKDCKSYVLISPDSIIFNINGAVKLQTFCMLHKLQILILKKNLGKIITDKEIIGNKIFAKNTIGWQLVIQS